MKLLVVTGAGISLASGIPTFRGDDPEAVWKNDVMEKGTRAFFHRDPVASWQWYTQRFAKYYDKEPNEAHKALAELEARVPDFLLVTQNIDNLHEKAGSKKLIHVHGSMDKVRCSRQGCEFGAPRGFFEVGRPSNPWKMQLQIDRFVEDPKRETLPRCLRCNKLVRPHILWFDEYYSEHELYAFDDVVSFAKEATHVIFVGTSLQVGVTARVLSEACDRESERADVKVIDPNRVPAFFPTNVKQVWERAEDWLPKFVAGLS